MNMKAQTKAQIFGMIYSGLLVSLRTTLNRSFVDPAGIGNTGKMSLTFLLKTCLYGCVLQGVKKDGSVSGHVVFAKPNASKLLQ
jgi:hypothetical protein